MVKIKRMAAALALVFLGGASAQGGAWTVYFVFKLATTLPVTLQATPECASERVAWESATATPETAPDLRLLETYSFVSARSGDELRQDIEAFAREHDFSAAEPSPQDTASLPGLPDREEREFQGSSAPGHRYAVRIYDRPGTPGAASVVCITVRAARGSEDPVLPSSQDD